MPFEMGGGGHRVVVVSSAIRGVFCMASALFEAARRKVRKDLLATDIAPARITPRCLAVRRHDLGTRLGMDFLRDQACQN